MTEKGERKTTREILEFILMIILALAITQGIHYSASYILKVETPFVVVASGSMVPTLNVGDLLIVQGVNSRDLHVGDIIVFKPPYPYWKGVPWVHRIIDKRVRTNEVEYRTKGDANIAPDPFWVKSSNVIGKVLYRIPYLGYASLFLKGWTIPIIAIIFILIFIGYTALSRKD